MGEKEHILKNSNIKEIKQYTYIAPPIAQEQHHAMHVLLFFQILACRTLNGERIKRSILGRIIHHLMDLREFLEDGSLSDLTNVLCESVQQEYDNSLPYLARRIHRGIKIVARAFDHGEGQPFLSTVTTVLIVWSEHEENPKICMYPWLVANQNKILRFADYYGKTDVFKGLLPISKTYEAKGA